MHHVGQQSLIDFLTVSLSSNQGQQGLKQLALQGFVGKVTPLDEGELENGSDGTITVGHLGGNEITLLERGSAKVCATGGGYKECTLGKTYHVGKDVLNHVRCAGEIGETLEVVLE